jgi:hypothetical protein
MTNLVRGRGVLACVLVVLGALVALVLVRNGERDGRQWPVHGAARSSEALFGISGDVTDPLMPGERAALDLELVNRHSIALSITDLQVSIRHVNAPRADRTHPCGLADFSVEQVPRDTHLAVPAREKRRLSELGLRREVWPRLVLVNRPVNQDGCKGASLVLGYSAAGVVGR